MSGWLKIHRCITTHWLYTEHRVYSKYEAWLDILLTVNFADAQVLIKGKIYNVKRGESIFSMESWGKRWNWDKSKVRRFMSLLEKDSMIVVKSDNITTHLSVCKYDSYQDKRISDDTQANNKRIPSKHQTTPIKEEEEKKEEKKQFKAPTVGDLKSEFPNIDAESFHDFYTSKGWKIGKDAMKDWRAAARNWERRNNPTQNKPFTLKNKATLNDD